GVVGEARHAEPGPLSRDDQHVALPELVSRLETGDEVELVNAIEAGERALQLNDVEDLAGLRQLEAPGEKIRPRVVELADRDLAEPPLDEKNADDAFADLLRRDQRARGDHPALVVQRVDVVREAIQLAEV